MKELDLPKAFEMYWNILIKTIPDYVFLALAVLLCICVFFFLLCKGLLKGLIYSIRLLLAELVFILYGSTFIFRIEKDIRYNFHPFWSYEAIQNGKTNLLVENMMNVLVFIPIGLLIALGFSNWSWWKAIGFGCLISVSIEMMQFVTERGFCEVDDVMHNTLGCTAGFGIAKICWKCYETFLKNK